MQKEVEYHTVAGGVLRRIGIDAVQWLEKHRNLGVNEARRTLPSRHKNMSEERDFWITISRGTDEFLEACRSSIKQASVWHREKTERVTALNSAAEDRVGRWATEELRHEWLFNCYADRRCRRYLHALREIGGTTEALDSERQGDEPIKYRQFVRGVLPYLDPSENVEDICEEAETMVTGNQVRKEIRKRLKKHHGLNEKLTSPVFCDLMPKEAKRLGIEA